MKITYKGDYALKAVLELSMVYGIQELTGSDLATRIDAPKKFLEQILLELKKGGFVKSKRGNVGGYYLSRAPQQITVGDIIRVIEGPIEPIACIDERYRRCRHVKKCVFKKIWQRVFIATTDIVDHVNFQQLADEASFGRQVIEYYI